MGDVMRDLKECNIENQRLMDKFNSNDQLVLLVCHFNNVHILKMIMR